MSKSSWDDKDCKPGWDKMTVDERVVRVLVEAKRREREEVAREQLRAMAAADAYRRECEKMGEEFVKDMNGAMVAYLLSPFKALARFVKQLFVK